MHSSALTVSGFPAAAAGPAEQAASDAEECSPTPEAASGCLAKAGGERLYTGFPGPSANATATEEPKTAVFLRVREDIRTKSKKFLPNRDQ